MTASRFAYCLIDIPPCLRGPEVLLNIEVQVLCLVCNVDATLPKSKTFVLSCQSLSRSQSLSFACKHTIVGMGSNGEHHQRVVVDDSLQWLGKPRPVRVIVVGAGISGIAAVKLFNERLGDQPVSLTVYEKNSDVGGTWLENRYPG